jgi:8-oxo-dGTP pyrophosphatase MutT (NUDIX family)
MRKRRNKDRSAMTSRAEDNRFEGLAEGSNAPAGGLLTRLRENLMRPRAPRRASRGDHDLNPGMARNRELVPAAVLIAIIGAASGPDVLFTKRAAGLADHAGEISFPGGRIEPGDLDPVAAALRESEEELGISPAQVEILGALDIYETRTGFRVSPVVGLVAPPVVLRPDAREVAEVLQVPLAHLLERANHRRFEAQDGGTVRHFYAIPFGPHVIWGATAGMIMNLCEVMDLR